MFHRMGQRTVIVSLCLLPTTLAASERSVRAWQETLTLPTYGIGEPDKTPIFVERRSYQGAEAPIYPYAMLDALTDKRENKDYTAVYLENEYVRICLLPEIGGRVFWATDKTTGYDFLYRQNVIKPALIGMVGAWISGGIEWNIPHHHRASTFMPVDHSFAEEPDGSAVVRVGELELRHRMRWVVELRLRPGSSCVEQTMRLINRTATDNSFLFFANIAVPANRDYQVLFPPDTCWVTNHGKREFSRWPTADSIYNGIDFRKGVDASWWRNHPSPISMFCWGSKMNFVAGYDHGRQAGMVHVADRHISPGKKFFTWGAGEAGQMWDKELTDADGPYIELMAGSYSDNQPDYSWIGPYQTKVAETFWYPINGIEGVKNANQHCAVNFESASAAKARIGVAVTRVQPKLRVEIRQQDGAIYVKNTSARPGKPFLAEVSLPRDADRLSLWVFAGEKELISYTPAIPEPGEAPQAVRPPARPQDIESTDEVYWAGLRLEQLHSAALDPEDYYREVLRRDPGHAKAHTALGIRAWQRCRLAEAEKHLQAAVARATRLYRAPEDGEAHYYLGLVKRAQGQTDQAAESFERAAWVAGWQSPANQQLAELASTAGSYSQALVHLDRALAANQLNVKALTLKAAVLRRLERPAEAASFARRAKELDPLDPWPQWEQSLAGSDKVCPQGISVQSYLEPATDYAAAAMWPEAVAVLQACPEGALANAELNYFLAAYLENSGKAAEAEPYWAKAQEGSIDRVFPFRREAFEVFERASEHNPADHSAAYFLGNLSMLNGQTEHAIRHWQDSRQLNPTSALVHRNLAVAYSRQQDGLARAIESLESAIRLDAQEPRYFLELDQLCEAAKMPAAERLAVLEQNHEVVAQRDDSLAREVALLVEVGRYEDALRLLEGGQFHVWEGAGRTAVHNSFTQAHLSLGDRHFAARRYTEARQEYEAALAYPDNLGTGRPLRGERLAETYFRLARTCEAVEEPEAAARYYAKAVETGPAYLVAQGTTAADESESYYYAACALKKLGRGDEAARSFQSLVEVANTSLADHVPMNFFASFGFPQPQNIRFAQAHYTMGLGLLGLEKRSEAAREFRTAAALNPNHAAARSQLQLLEVPQ